MKKNYIAPELEIRTFRLTADILELSGEFQGENGGGEAATDAPVITPIGGDDL